MKLDELQGMNMEALREGWRNRFGGKPPDIRSTELLRYMFAWKLQAKRHGGLSTRTKQRLRRLADSFRQNPNYTPASAPSIKTGTVLTRDWQGTRHTVSVLPKGFEYCGKRYKSLSEVARTITGTRWSGPLFFGLRKPAPGRTA